MKVIVLGGYGNFGARICRALAHDPAVQLVVAARNLAAATAFGQPLGAKALALDVDDPALAQKLAAAGAGLVIHTAGPFQGQRWAVAQACAQAGCHYIDLADGRRFVCDFGPALTDAFRAAGRFAVTGASTVPALSSAVVDALLPRFAALACIDICIAPAQRAPRGVATMASVLSYCGEDVQVWRSGRWQALTGWAEPQPVQFARMATRPGALCDIPDLELLAQRYPGVQDVMFRAALEVRLGQQGMAGLAWLRKRRLLPRLSAWAGALNRMGLLLDPWGSPVGGMVVRLRGTRLDGQPLQLGWHITAGDHHGPEIPCMAAILLARKLAQGVGFPPGAGPCMGWLTLDEFAPEFERWGMVTDLAQEPVGDGA